MPALITWLSFATSGLLLHRCPPRQLVASPKRTVSLTMAELPAAATTLREKIKTSPESIQFSETMDAIASMYKITEVAFSVGPVASDPGQNMGSAKIFSFAKLSKLDQAVTLQLFGDYYRKDVLEHPNGTDHANIRAFIAGGWGCVEFPNGLALELDLYLRTRVERVSPCQHAIPLLTHEVHRMQRRVCCSGGLSTRRTRTTFHPEIKPTPTLFHFRIRTT